MTVRPKFLLSDHHFDLAATFCVVDSSILVRL